MDVRLKIDEAEGKVTAVMMWHPINGVWVHIAQSFEDGDIKYYTNGTELTELPNMDEETKSMINLPAKSQEKCECVSPCATCGNCEDAPC